MKYGIFNSDGRIEVSVNDDTVSSLPDGAHELNDDEWTIRFDLRLTVDGLVFDPLPRATQTLDEIKAVKNAEINAARAAANSSTFAYSGKVFACDALSRSDIDGVNGYVAIFGALPPDFPGGWKAVDNTFLPIADVEAWKIFFAAMIAQGAVNFAHAQELKAQLAAATTPEAVAAIVW